MGNSSWSALGQRLVSGQCEDWMRDTNESEFQVGEQANSIAAHHTVQPTRPVYAIEFAELLRIAIPNATTRQAAKVLNGRATFAAISHWQTGRRVPPKWVFERLSAMAIERVQRLGRGAPLNNPAVTGARTLAELRARQARERDQKKKPD